MHLNTRIGIRCSQSKAAQYSSRIFCFFLFLLALINKQKQAQSSFQVRRPRFACEAGEYDSIKYQTQEEFGGAQREEEGRVRENQGIIFHSDLFSQ